MEDSAASFIYLAGPCLQALDFKQNGHEECYSDNAIVVPYISTLQALTALSLSDVSAPSLVDFRPLRELSLLELTLERCYGMAKALMVPEALPSLQKLHLDDQALRNSSQSLSESDLQFARAVLSHPSLMELSGDCSLFKKVPEKWREWKRDTSVLVFCQEDEVWRKTM